MKKVLYVEDNLDTAEAVKIILSGVGYEVDLAHTGKEGLKKIENGIYDLVILDIMLPDMSGWDIFEKKEENKKCKYAFLSILPVEQERRKELAKEGVVDYLTKPFTKEELIKRIHSILKK